MNMNQQFSNKVLVKAIFNASPDLEISLWGLKKNKTKPYSKCVPPLWLSRETLPQVARAQPHVGGGP